MTYAPSNFPWVVDAEEDLGTDVPGGIVQRYKAAAALNIGDVVFLSAAFTVNKSVTEADYNAGIGVVVGGKQSGMQVLQRDGDVGTPAASAANEEVLVCVCGKAKVVAGAAIAAGNKITGSTVVAGRVAVGTITTDLAAGDTGRLLGMALEAAAGAGEKILAMIHLH